MLNRRSWNHSRVIWSFQRHMRWKTTLSDFNGIFYEFRNVSYWVHGCVHSGNYCCDFIQSFLQRMLYHYSIVHQHCCSFGRRYELPSASSIRIFSIGPWRLPGKAEEHGKRGTSGKIISFAMLTLLIIITKIILSPIIMSSFSRYKYLPTSITFSTFRLW